MEMKKLVSLFVISLMASFVSSSSIMSQVLQVLPTNNELHLTQKCQEKLNITKQSFAKDEIWAIKMVDASGRAQPGFVWGNNYWISSKELCEVINNPVDLGLSSRYNRRNIDRLTLEKSPFDVNYQIVYIRHNSVFQLDQKIYDKDIIHIGLCMPKQCTKNDTASVVELVLKTFHQEYRLIGNNFTVLTSKVVETKPESFENFFFYFLITGLSIYGSLILLATFYSIFIRKMLFVDIAKTMQVIENGNEVLYEKKQKQRKDHVDTFIMFFSLVENHKHFRKRDPHRSTISVIHGIRAVGMLWIIAAHIYFFSFGSVDNMQLAMNYADLFIAQPMLNAAINVDTFFALSGFLLAYTFYENASSYNRPLVTLYKFIVIRYLRITIPYIPIFFITTCLAIYMRGASSFWFIEQNDYNCMTYGWRNFLYINNWFPMNEMCIIPSWYLAVDFQCFLISIVLLVLSLRYPKTAFTCFVLIFLAGTAYSGYIGYIDQFSFLLDVQFNTLESTYFPTYTRIGGYIIGVAAGWYWMKLDKSIKLQQWFVYLGWSVFWILTLSIIFGQSLRLEDPIWGALFTAICRPLWALSMMWIIYACSLGYGGFITKVFNHKGLISYSRLSYAAYLVNPILIFWVSMISDIPFHMELVSTTVFAAGYIFFIYFFAKWFALIFEYPFVRLIKKIMKNIDKRREKKQLAGTRL